jgi:hypothetical protein
MLTVLGVHLLDLAAVSPTADPVMVRFVCISRSRDLWAGKFVQRVKGGYVIQRYQHAITDPKGGDDEYAVHVCG